LLRWPRLPWSCSALRRRRRRRNTYVRIFYTSFPLVKTKTSQNLKPWLTKGIKISCLNKRRLHLKYRNSNNPTFKTHYKRYCQILCKVITTAKRLHHDKLILQSDDKNKTTWDIIKTITNNTKTSHTNIPIHININETRSTNPINTENAFNAYFRSVADKLLKYSEIQPLFKKTGGGDRNSKLPTNFTLIFLFKNYWKDYT
jgi:hypothetical protein